MEPAAARGSAAMKERRRKVFSFSEGWQEETQRKLRC